MHTWVDRIRGQLERFLDFDGVPNAAVMVNNYDWMGKFGYLEFLRDVGKHFPVNVMLTKDSVRSRLMTGESVESLLYASWLRDGEDRFAFLAAWFAECP